MIKHFVVPLLVSLVTLCSIVPAAHANPILVMFNHGGELDPFVEAVDRLRSNWQQKLPVLDGIGDQKFKKPVHNCAQFVKAVGGEISSAVTYAAPSPLGDYDQCASLSAMGWAKPTQSSLFYDQYDREEQYSMEQDLADHLDLSTLPLSDAWGLKGHGPVFARDLKGATIYDPDSQEVPRRQLAIVYRKMRLTLTEEAAADFEDRGDQQELIDYQVAAEGRNTKVEERGGSVLLVRDAPRGTITAKPIRIRTPRRFKIPDDDVSVH